MKIAFLTLGCKVNFYETEKMMSQFRKLGFDIVDFTDVADVYIVNTCTVTAVADKKSRQMLHRAKKNNPDSLVVAVGCYVESGKERLDKDVAVDACFSNSDKEHIAEEFVRHFGLDHKRSKESTNKDFHHDRTRAYVKIQDGCNQFCTYCIIPYVRGRGKLVSTPEDQVVEQVKHLADLGYKEVVLTGIHLSSYGVDLSDAKSFVELEGRPLLSVIQKVADIDGISRIRLGSLEPRIITESFLKGLVKIDKVCPHFHLSLQSGCDSVLQRMNRHYTTSEYKEKVELLRKYYDKPAITTDVIVGFPRENITEFECTCDFVRDIKLSDIHIFPYSRREGTVAARNSDIVVRYIKRGRVEILTDIKKELKKSYGDLFRGTEQDVLFEEVVHREDGDYLIGHTDRYIKLGIPLSEAIECGYRENEIHKISADRQFDLD